MFLSREVDIKLCQNYTETYICKILYKICIIKFGICVSFPLAIWVFLLIFACNICAFFRGICAKLIPQKFHILRGIWWQKFSTKCGNLCLFFYSVRNLSWTFRKLSRNCNSIFNQLVPNVDKLSEIKFD